MQKLRNLSLAVIIFFLLLSLYKHRDSWLGQLGEELPGLPTRMVTLHSVTPDAALLQRSGPVSYAAAVRQAAPAVVNIYTTEEIRLHPITPDLFFQRFFGTLPTMTQKRQGLGSGVLVSADGYILTNNHVIAGADSIVVAMADGRETQAKVVGSDPDTDIAVLKIALNHVPVAHLRLDPPLQVGDVVLAIGNPFGFSQSVTQGIVSALGRQGLGINTFEDFIQTDAAINPGNSGGALIDALGNVIGINSAIYSRNGGNMGIGFAIPIAQAKDVMAQIIAHGRVVRGWLGIGLAMPSGMGTGPGSAQQPVIIDAMVQGGPADQAGILPGDQILALAGQVVHDPEQAIHQIAALKPGTQVHIDLRRDGRVLPLEVPVAERPQEQALPAPAAVVNP